jgi:hypothetical protein
MKAFNGRSIRILPRRTSRELWATVLGALRTNIQVVADANARALGSWNPVVRLLDDGCPDEG